jgi:hypothetical protein
VATKSVGPDRNPLLSGLAADVGDDRGWQSGDMGCRRGGYGNRVRSWWIALAGLGAVSLALLPAWLEYVTVIRNATEWSFDSSIGNVPLMSIPLIARWGRSSPIDTPGSVPSASIQP